MKKGFSLILAIIFILLVASIGALSMAISSSSAKTSVNLFIHEQAKLLADGAAEYAIMKVQQNLQQNFATTCVDEIEINYPNDKDKNPTFRANISITYIGDKDTIKHCANKIESEKTGLQSIIISGQVRSLLDETASSNFRENFAYSFTTTQIP